MVGRQAISILTLVAMAAAVVLLSVIWMFARALRTAMLTLADAASNRLGWAQHAMWWASMAFRMPDEKARAMAAMHAQTCGMAGAADSAKASQRGNN